MNFLADYTPQQVFYRVVDHLCQQGCQANADGRCVYLTADGKKCAAGCLIPDGHAAQHRGGEWRHIIETFPELSGPHNSLILCLQFFHDNYSNWATKNSFSIGLHTIALDFDLVYDGRVPENLLD